MNIINRAN